jgi:SNF2 family DNA or RNA helicase
MRTLEDVVSTIGLPFTMTDMQIEDTKQMVHWGRALADLPVGSGKTVVATVAAVMLEPDIVVLAVPPILIVQWCKWLRSLQGVGKVLEYTASPAARKNLDLSDVRWLVTSFGMFRADVKQLQSKLSGRDVLTVIDEAHCIKNSTSKLHKYVREFSAGQSLLLMTGTPLSGPMDAYAYIKLNTPTIYRNKTHFENIHVETRDFFGGVTKWRALGDMHKNLSLRRVRRTKEEVHAALPKANYIPIYYDLAPAHMKLYKQLMDEQLLELDSGGKIDATTAQTLYHYAQQIIVNYPYFADDETLVSNTFDLLDQVVDEVGLHGDGSSKLIVWTQYKMTSRRVLAHMKTKAPTVAAFSETNSKKAVADFLDDPKVRVLVAQPGSAGAGLNPQHLCWECIFVEAPTTTIAFTQAAGRIDRFGQKYNPNIRIAVARGTVQESLLAKLLANDSLVSKVTGDVKSLRNMIFPK